MAPFCVAFSSDLGEVAVGQLSRILILDGGNSNIFKIFTPTVPGEMVKPDEHILQRG